MCRRWEWGWNVRFEKFVRSKNFILIFRKNFSALHKGAYLKEKTGAHRQDESKYSKMSYFVRAIFSPSKLPPRNAVIERKITSTPLSSVIRCHCLRNLILVQINCFFFSKSFPHIHFHDFSCER